LSKLNRWLVKHPCSNTAYMITFEATFPKTSLSSLPKPTSSFPSGTFWSPPAAINSSFQHWLLLHNRFCFHQLQQQNILSSIRDFFVAITDGSKIDYANVIINAGEKIVLVAKELIAAKIVLAANELIAARGDQNVPEEKRRWALEVCSGRVRCIWVCFLFESLTDRWGGFIFGWDLIR